MLTNIFKHFLHTNRDLIMRKSLKNCHAMGLHSVVLNVERDRLTRMFFATPTHTLWRNEQYGGNLSLAFHPHHCDLVLLCVQGAFENVVIRQHKNGGYVFDKYEYRSMINGHDGGFTLLEQKVRFYQVSRNTVAVGHAEIMKANWLHTVIVEQDEIAAWMVEEGPEDPTYQSICYSNCNPNDTFDPQMYQPFNGFEEIVDLFREHKLL